MFFFLGKSPAISWSVVHHRSTCMQPGMAGPSLCSCSSLSSGSPWIISLPGHYSLPDCSQPFALAINYLHVWWVYTDVYLCAPMMHCSQGLEDSVEHRTWSLRARGEALNLGSWGVQAGARLKDSCWCLGLWCFQEPPKEDLTVSEKFQLVLDVAQRAQVRRGGQAEALFNIWPHRWLDLHHSCFNFPSQNLFGKLANILEKIRKWVGLFTHAFLQCWLWCRLNSACLCVQFVHVGSAWADSEAVCGTVDGLHLLLPAAIQTAGLHHRYIRYSH